MPITIRSLERAHAERRPRVWVGLLVVAIILANISVVAAEPTLFVHGAALPPQVRPLGPIRRLPPAGETVVYNFRGRSDGSYPNWGVIEFNGSFYGSTIVGGKGPCHFRGFDRGCGVVFRLSLVSGHYTETILHTFQGGNDGSAPSGLIADAAGALYGTTQTGGSGPCTGGCGTVFKLTPSGSGYNETILYTFQGGADGKDPIDQLLADPTGALYGVTYSGGGSSACNARHYQGCGTVFKLTPTGSGYTESILHAFSGKKDGAQPTDGVVALTSGSLYGTTNFGGRGPHGGNGTVYSLTSTKTGYKERILYRFLGSPNDGQLPDCYLIADSNGTLYGTTALGGTKGVGTVFKLTPSGGGYTESLLYDFLNIPDGRYPNASLIFVSGALFGMTIGGGSPSSAGTIYKLSPSGSGWAESVVYSFGGAPADGYHPGAGALIADETGALYGTTQYGGSGKCKAGLGCGTIFKFTP